MPKLSYATCVAIGFDQFCNALLGGSPDETFSARCWRKKAHQPWKALRMVIDTLFFWQNDRLLGGHCRQSWRNEMLRAHLPRSYRICNGNEEA